MLYGYLRLPWTVRRYRLTNRRVAILSGIHPRVERFVDLDRFDVIVGDTTPTALLNSVCATDHPPYRCRLPLRCGACC